MALLRFTATVGGYTLLSRILGFVRDVAIAHFVAAGPVADAFFVAFRFPNMFRRLVGEGAFANAFVPLFARRLEGAGRAGALAFAEQALAVMLAAMFVLLLAAELAMPWLISVLAPGFAADPERFALTVELTRITFPYLLFMALVALLGAVLNALLRFAAAAATPILLNIVLIAALFGLGHVLETPGHALAWGVAAAGAGQFLFMLIACRRAGAPLRLRRPRLTPGVRRLLVLMLPGLVGAGVHQINLLVSTIVASFEDGAVSFLYYADRLVQLPLGVVGVAMGVALLPLLARQLRGGAAAEAVDIQNRAIEFALLLTLPATAALLAVPGPIVAVLFEHGAFDAADTAATAAALAAYAAGLPAYVLVKVLSPGFFAREDMVAPVKIAAAAMVLNVALAVALFLPFGHVGVAVATAAASWLNALLLGAVLYRRGHLSIDARLRARVPRMAVAALAMAGVVFGLAWLLVSALAGGVALRIAALTGLVLVGLGVFGGLAVVTGVARPDELRGLFRRANRPS
ncbi:MAG: murein biosynthesis integral membrane protein MurJ [Rhodospirillaceae bacterium]|nr:murein biosynthesis integral membrane protein MurJ [Rhodospirillaceae bacterium]